MRPGGQDSFQLYIGIDGRSQPLVGFIVYIFIYIIVHIFLGMYPSKTRKHKN
jgi:hypothetical protein